MNLLTILLLIAIILPLVVARGNLRAQPQPQEEQIIQQQQQYTCREGSIQGAFAGKSGFQHENCFHENKHSDWGWSINLGKTSGTFKFDVYGNVNKCDMQQEGTATVVGSVEVTLDVAAQTCTGVYTAAASSSDDNNKIMSFQFYCGSGKFPLIDGEPEVNPELYPCIDNDNNDDSSSSNSKSCTLNDIGNGDYKGNYYAIAHSLSCTSNNWVPM